MLTQTQETRSDLSALTTPKTQELNSLQRTVLEAFFPEQGVAEALKTGAALIQRVEGEEPPADALIIDGSHVGTFSWVNHGGNLHYCYSAVSSHGHHARRGGLSF